MNQPYTVLKIATDIGPLAQIWLAANMSNIPRGSILQTSISESAKEIAKVSGCTPELSENNEHITLQASGELLQGIVRVYSRQAGFLLSDIKDTLTKIGSLFKISSRVSVTISKVNTIAKIDQLILEDTVTEKEVLVTPSLDFLNESANFTTLLEADDSMRRNMQGAAAGMWDISLEVGRGSNTSNNFEQNSSAVNLDFDIDDGFPLGTSDEGTRNTGSNSIESSQMKTTLPGEDDDFPVDDQFNNDWDLGINENNHNEDRSVEIGRRAADSALEEHTEFGFELDIGKDHLEEIDEDMNIETNKPSLLPKKTKIQNRLLSKTVEIIVDNELVLSKNELNTVTSNSNATEAQTEKDTVNFTKKRLWSELDKELGFLPSNIINGLLSFEKFKKHKIADNTIVSDDRLPLDMSIDLGNNSIDNFDMIDGNFEDVEIASPTASDHGMNFEGLDEMDENNPANDTESGSEQSIRNIKESEDQIKLNTGELASKETVELANTLRTQVNDSNITFKNILNKHIETEQDTVANKKDVSKCFFDMLSLATAGCIDLEQDKAFGTISVTTNASLFEKFIPA